MSAERRHNHWTAIAVVSGMVDVLHAGSKINAAPHVDRVIRFHDVLPTIVQFAVAEQKAEPAIGEVGLMIFLDCVGDKGDACPVLLAMPPGADRSQSYVDGLIDFRVGEGFGFAVIPAKAAECSEVMSEILLQVHAESVLAGNVPGMSGDFWNRSEAFLKVGNGLSIDSHVGVIGVGQQPDHSPSLRDEAVT